MAHYDCDYCGVNPKSNEDHGMNCPDRIYKENDMNFEYNIVGLYGNVHSFNLDQIYSVSHVYSIDLGVYIEVNYMDVNGISVAAKFSLDNGNKVFRDYVTGGS